MKTHPHIATHEILVQPNLESAETDIDDLRNSLSNQERIDEAMAESFPASDPPSWTTGIKQKEDELTEDSSH